MCALRQMAADVRRAFIAIREARQEFLKHCWTPGLGHPPQCLPSASRRPFTGIVPSWHPEVSKAF
jgi:hypothetical protein